MSLFIDQEAEVHGNFAQQVPPRAVVESGPGFRPGSSEASLLFLHL